ncbi:hypothetical protein Runsl_3093 [Runella slithyformis DSM 19594]|uniref:Uncharacterized protein n=1 Tax=Runella slithyformis (strain ATCC 29530 / DSM 19594 / LMG 11500 / NCIMB 11436 / LSU 4) TaxID=761193 RepID=A0A7U3ZLN3_RUNSL|nr:hypothetical protein Runsl_3093 [Runella slithyformis DSM 19594]
MIFGRVSANESRPASCEQRYIYAGTYGYLSLYAFPELLSFLYLRLQNYSRTSNKSN